MLPVKSSSKLWTAQILLLIATWLLPSTIPNDISTRESKYLHYDKPRSSTRESKYQHDDKPRSSGNQQKPKGNDNFQGVPGRRWRKCSKHHKGRNGMNPSQLLTSFTNDGQTAPASELTRMHTPNIIKEDDATRNFKNTEADFIICLLGNPTFTPNSLSLGTQALAALSHTKIESKFSK